MNESTEKAESADGVRHFKRTLQNGNTSEELLGQFPRVGEIVLAVDRMSPEKVYDLFMRELQNNSWSAKQEAVAALRSGEIEPEISLFYYPTWVTDTVGIEDFEIEWQTYNNSGTASYTYNHETTGYADLSIPHLHVTVGENRVKEIETVPMTTENIVVAETERVNKLIDKACENGIDRLLKDARQFAESDMSHRVSGPLLPTKTKFFNVHKYREPGLLGLVPVYTLVFTYEGRSYTSFFSGIDSAQVLDFPIRETIKKSNRAAGFLSLAVLGLGVVSAVLAALRSRGLDRALPHNANTVLIVVSAVAAVVGLIGCFIALMPLTDATHEGCKKRIGVNIVLLVILTAITAAAPFVLPLL